MNFDSNSKQQPTSSSTIQKYFLKDKTNLSSEDEFDFIPKIKSTTQDKDENVLKKRKEIQKDKVSPPKKKIHKDLRTNSTSVLFNGNIKGNPLNDVKSSTDLSFSKLSLEMAGTYTDLIISSNLSHSSDESISLVSSVLKPNRVIVCKDQEELKENQNDFDTFLDMEFDSWEDQETHTNDSLNLSAPIRCKILSITTLQSKVTLSLCSLQNNQKALCNLEGFWIFTNLAVDNIIYITAKNIDGTWIVNNEHGLLVLEPDLLLSSTFVVGSLWCKRRSILSEYFKGFDTSNKAMLVGVTIHHTLQYVLKNSISDTVKIEEYIQKYMKSPRIIKTLYECGLSSNAVKVEVFGYISRIQDFVTYYVSNISTDQAQNEDNWIGRIDAIDDIEENIWCPELGVKGKIDVTVKANQQIMPLELKTGKATLSLEHRGQLILYLMMMKKLGYNVTTGLLLYVKEGILKEIPGASNEERDLVRLRNELVYYLTRTANINEDNMLLSPPELPEPINHRGCSNCPYKTICTAYAHFTGEDITSKKALKEIQHETLRYLSQSHIEYFMKWTCLLILEQADNGSQENKNIYLLTPEERESRGRCIANLKISKVSDESDETYEHVFEKADRSCLNVPESGIKDNNYVVISSTKRCAIATGFVTSISTNSISVSLERNLNKKYKNHKFCIDSYNSSQMQTFQFSSLALLLESDPKAEHLRKIIIDKVQPTFKPTLPKIIGSVGKAILRKLNIVQQRAVLKALTANDYFLIKGMPGTGKTSTIVALIQLLYELGKSVLITSHTNSAVDNVCLKLIKNGVKFMRLGSHSKIHRDLWEYSEQNLTKDCSTVEEFQKVFDSVQIVGVTCLSSGHPLLTKRTLDICIVDESTQVLQSSVIRPLYACKTFILLGDPDQLPAVVRNKRAQDLGMSESLFERLSIPEATIALNINYRMNKTITDLANTFTYNGELTVGSKDIGNATITVDKTKLERLYDHKGWIFQILDTSLEKSVQFLDTGPVWNLSHDVSWRITKLYDSNKDSSQNTHVNIHEAAIIFKIVKALINGGIKSVDIGVICTYKHQVEQLSAILKSDCVDVNTVDQFQGKDKSIIIYSCGSSRDTSVFKSPGKHDILEDKRRLTVAITRTKHKLVIVGDVNTLLVYSTFKKLLSFFTNNVIKLCDCIDFVWQNVLDLNSF